MEINPNLLTFVSHAWRGNYAESFESAGKIGYKPADHPFENDLLEKHLNGGPWLAMFFMAPGEETLRLATLDLDNKDGALAWPRMCEAAGKLIKAARERGLEAWAIRSGGGQGLHLHFRWDAPQKAAEVRRALRAIINAEGYAEGTGGVDKGQIEILPKGDKGNLSSHVAVPLGRRSSELGPDFEPTETMKLWISSHPLSGYAVQQQEADSSDDDTVADALKFVHPDSRKRRVDVGLILRNTLGEEGYARWREWLTGWDDRPDDNITRRRWNGFKNRKGDDGIGLGSLYFWARENGWKGCAPGVAPAFSDEWIALRFAEEQADTLRYTHSWNAWHQWTGTHWRRDDTLLAFNLGRICVRQIAATANKKKVSVASAKTVAAAVSLARADRRLAAKPEQWDQDLWLLGTPGGTVDLRTGEMREAREEEYVTRLATVTPGGECPTWLRFVREICGGDESLPAYLQRLAGYCLTGDVREHALVFFHGNGRNGKSTFIDVLQAILGAYAQTVAMNTLIMTRHQEHPTEIAKLSGTRLAVASETQDGARWNAARIKQLTGGDRLTGRFMRADYFDFVPTHKLVVLSNKKPLLGFVDDAISGRIHMVPFRVKFATGAAIKEGERRADVHLREKLNGELGGVLGWAIEGCVQWQKVGLAPPASVISATEDYLHNQDDMQVWIDECCVVEGSASMSLGELYESWKAWCDKSGAWPGPKNDFGQRLGARGFEVYKPKNIPTFKGIRAALKREDNDELPF